VLGDITLQRQHADGLGRLIGVPRHQPRPA
jgi:hypothetical protein